MKHSPVFVLSCARSGSTLLQQGPGDATAYASSMISASSLGRGSTLGWDGVSRNLIKRANALLEQLGYGPLQSEER